MTHTIMQMAHHIHAKPACSIIISIETSLTWRTHAQSCQILWGHTKGCQSSNCSCHLHMKRCIRFKMGCFCNLPVRLGEYLGSPVNFGFANIFIFFSFQAGGFDCDITIKKYIIYCECYIEIPPIFKIWPIIPLVFDSAYRRPFNTGEQIYDW